MIREIAPRRSPASSVEELGWCRQQRAVSTEGRRDKSRKVRDGEPVVFEEFFALYSGTSQGAPSYKSLVLLTSKHIARKATRATL